MPKTYIIAEIGPNHNGSYDMALELIEKLAGIGVDAVKFQLGDARNSLSLDAFKADYQKNNDNAEDIFEATKKRQLSHESHKKLAIKCKELNVDYLCTAFDMDSLIFLDQEIDVPKFKIASGEIFSIDLLEYMISKNKPLILSTGMASFEEIERVYEILSSESKNKDITILHCVTSYPASLESINLNVMLELKEKFKTKIGYSDHSLGNIASLSAVAMGASIIEKHVTLDKSLPGPDHQASATISEFKNLVKNIREIELIKGSYEKIFLKTEVDISKVARKSIVAKRLIKKGTIIKIEDICFKRPGIGFLPIDRHLVLGRKAITDIEENRVIREEQIS